METKSRFYSLMETGKPILDENKEPKNGPEFVIFYNKFGWKKIACILNWRHGYLNSEPGYPAVQFEDTHTEHWRDGKLHCEETDDEGNLKPAVFANYGENKEYWLNGKRQY